MKRGLLVGFLLGFISVSVVHAELGGYMGALEQIVTLMKELIVVQKGMAKDIRGLAARHGIDAYTVVPSDGAAR